MSARYRTLALVVAIPLAACGSDDPVGDTVATVATGDAMDDADVPGVEPVDPSPLGGEWVVDQLTVDGDRVELDPSWPITLAVDGDVISGAAACNGYTGVIDVSDGAGHGSFAVADLSWTEMGCASPAMEVEQAFLSALQAVDSYEVADGVYVGTTGVGTSFHLIRADPGDDADSEHDVSASPAMGALTPGGGLDGPVMYAARSDVDEAMAAQILGTLELDGDCLYTAFEGNRYPVLWPYGTTWDDDASSVVLPDGTTIELGGEVDGGGGYLYADTIGGFTDDASVLERAEQCAEEPYFEIAVMQSI